MYKKFLSIELVPKSCWYSNLRKELPTTQWDKIRRDCYRKAGYKCEICGGVGKKHPVECHEIWEFDDKTHIQTLTGVIALCPSCHEVKHFGLAMVKGKDKVAKKHLCKVNEWSSEDADLYIEGVFEQYHKRSQHNWELDISIVEKLLEQI
jgi:hypothetical protein